MFLNRIELDTREHIKEMVKGYPNFIEKYIGGSCCEIKREALLFKI